MPRQPVDRDHSDPVVHGISMSVQRRSVQKPVPESANVLQGFLAVKNEEVGIVNGPGVPWDLSKTSCDVREGWWPETGACHENAQGVDIVADRSPAHQTGLDQRRATSHVRIVDGVTSLRQALDEELWKLG